MTTYSAISKNTTSYTAIPLSDDADVLLLEDDSFFLLEDGFQLVLEQSTGTPTTYTALTKN